MEEKDLDLEKVSDTYYTEVKEDLIEDGLERKLVFNVKNYYDEVLHEIELRGMLGDEVNPDDVTTNIIEEEVDDEGKRKVSVFQGRNAKQVLKFDAIKEVDSKYEKDSTLDH